MSASILVVEDYADLRLAIVTALSRRAYVCDEVTTPDDAIAKLRGKHYKAILLSPRLPLSDDPVMHFLMSEQPGEVGKVILMTDPDLDDEAAEPACRELQKPFNNEQLFAKLNLR